MMSTINNQRPTILRPMFTMMSLFCLLIVSGFIYAAQNVMNFDSNINEAVLAISPDIPTIRRGAGGQQTITITNKGPDSANNTFATYTEQPIAGVAITSVTLSNGTACNVTQTSPKTWKCPLGYLANGSSAKFLVNYSTTTTANLGDLQVKGVVRAGSDELNPGSGVGESAYRIWGSETQETTPSKYGAFMVGFNGTAASTLVDGSGNGKFGPYSYEGSSIVAAWPTTQASPNGGYLDYGIPGPRSSYYLSSALPNPPTVQRLVTSLSNISVLLRRDDNTNNATDNRRAWELRTGILVPTGTTQQDISLCVGNTNLWMDDSGYIMANGQTVGTARDTWNNAIYAAPLTLNEGYNVITYRIANRNETKGYGGEVNQGGFGVVGIVDASGNCTATGMDSLSAVGENARVNIIDAAALVITKTNNTDSVNAIGQTTYTLTVENQGPSDVTGAILTDPVATNMTKGTPVCSTIANNQCTAGTTPTVAQLEAGYALPTLASGQKYILNVPVTLNALAASSVTNTASVKSPTTVSALGTACVNDTSSNITRSFDAASQTCTTSDTDKVRPRVQIAKTSIGNVGTFNFNVTNASTSSDSVTTATAGTAVTSNVIHHVETISNSLVINELSTTGFTLSSASCIDNNASISGNTTNAIGSLSNSTLTIDPTYLKPGANFVCSFTNSLKQITVSGRVFNDNSGTTSVNSNAYNGVQDAGETGIAGSKVQLKDSAGAVIAEVLTNATGDYTFNVSPEKLTPAFTIVATNAAGYTSVSGTSGSGGSYDLSSDTITLSKTSNFNYPNNNFGDAKLALVITPNNQQTTIAGGVVDYPHKISSLAVITMNSINSIAAQSPANSADQPWQSVIYLDSNCNGKVDVGETVLTGTSTLNPVQSICVVHRVNVPINASAGAQQVVSLQANGTATSGNTPVTSNTVTDTTLVGSAGLDMKKGVRVVSSCPSTVNDTNAFVTANKARNGNFLEYEITYRNNSTKNLVDVIIKDSVPTGMVFKSQTCNTTPTGITCTPTQSGNSLRWSMSGKLPPATSGTVRYCVSIP
nr:SdrD B-like domain-containing protein [Enhydrobacter aerosaccus]